LGKCLQNGFGFKKQTMEKRKIYCNCLIFIGIAIITGCSTVEKIPEKNEKPLSFSAYLGGSKGGFIERSDIDAISGASNSAITDSKESSLKFCLGLHMEYKMNNRHKVEAGLDFIPYQQSVFYNDPLLDYHGRLDIDYYRLSLPLTYNFSILRNKNKNAVLYLKTGLSLNYVNTYNTQFTGTIPGFSMNKFAIVPLFGITIIPVRFHNYSLGLFFNTSLLKGSKVFTDEIYHKSNNTGLMSTMEMGLYLNMIK
jgi:hypothetical protein